MRDNKVLGFDIGAYNLCEFFVIESMERIIPANADFCVCSICVEDVYALALNRIPARYIQNDYSDHDSNNIIDLNLIDSVVSEAIALVLRNPHH